MLGQGNQTVLQNEIEVGAILPNTNDKIPVWNRQIIKFQKLAS